MPSPLLQFLATPLQALVVHEENLVLGFGPPTLEMLPPSLHMSSLCGLDVTITFLNYDVKNLTVIQKARSNKPT